MYIIDSIGEKHSFIGEIDVAIILDNTIDCLVIGEKENDEKNLIEGILERSLEEFRKLELLIIDEWRYCHLDKRSSELVFLVISESYEKKSLILTTNLPFSEWGKIVADEQLAAAMIDRIVHFGHLVDTGNVEWRLKLSPMNQQMVKKR